MKISTTISSLEQTIRKLNAVYLADGVNDKARSQISSELEALDWAVDFIKDKLIPTIIIIGHHDFVEPFLSDLEEMPTHNTLDIIIKRSEDLITVIIYEPSDPVYNMCQEQFNPEGLDGHLLRKDFILDYLICHNYFGSSDIDDNDKKVLCFKTSIRPEYISSTAEVTTWAKNIYSQIKWDTSNQR